MATPDPSLVRKIVGRLVKDPTDLSTAYPHGGTPLGNVSRIEWAPGIKTRMITAEEFGGAVVEVVFGGQVDVLGVALRDFDADALGLVFPNTGTGAAGGKLLSNVVQGTGRAGIKLTSLACKLYVSPEAIDQEPGLYLPRAIPMIDKTAKLRWSWNDEWTTPALFVGSPDATGRCSYVGLRSDLPAL